MLTTRKLAVILLPLSLFITAHAENSHTRMIVPTSGLSLLSQATLIEPLDPQVHLQFTVWLKLRNKEALDKLVPELYDSNSPNYHNFLTKGDFDKYYAPHSQTENAVARYFIEQGMRAKIVNHRVQVSATVEQIEHILHVKMNQYSIQNRIVYAHAQEPSLPSHIAPYVQEISGLDNISRVQPHFRKQQAILATPQQTQNLDFSWEAFVPFAQPTTTSLNGFSGAELRTTFNLGAIPPVQNTVIDGKNQTIVIIDVCDNYSSAQIIHDANLYNAANGLALFNAHNFAVINPDGTPFTKCTSETGWDVEIALDVQAAHTVAPGANIVLVLAPDDGSGLMPTALSDVINGLINNHFTIAGFPNALVVSNSWGEIEEPESATEDLLESAAAHGISFNFSTGDCGDQTYTSNGCDYKGKAKTVGYPASSSYVTAVGGTSMFVDTNWNYAFETGWGTFFSGAFDSGSGGGLSHINPIPSWQNPIGHFMAGGYGSGTIATYGGRAIPDVGMLGDYNTGLIVSQGGQRFIVGGTSLSCPLFSATLALINQTRMLSNKTTPIGLAAPYLYSTITSLQSVQALNLIAPPHQIIRGAKAPPAGAPLSAFTIHYSNVDVTFDWDSSLSIEPAGQFWNDVTGVGSPNIPNFVPAMANM